MLLSFKQPNIPVLFLTDAGTAPSGDIRASSLQEAVRFASRWNLLGIVSAAEPLVYAPRLVKVVKESGLVCVSYGTLNNKKENVKLQVKQGIDAVIVDSVLAIRRGLTDEEKSQSDAATEGKLAKTLNGSMENLKDPVLRSIEISTPESSPELKVSEAKGEALLEGVNGDRLAA